MDEYWLIKRRQEELIAEAEQSRTTNEARHAQAANGVRSRRARWLALVAARMLAGPTSR
jgi:hypothetical protein